MRAARVARPIATTSLGADGAAGQQHVGRGPLPHDARQADRRAVAHRHAPSGARTRRTPPCRRRCGCRRTQRHAQPAGAGMALDGGDDRLAERRPQRPSALPARKVIGAGAELLQIGAGAETRRRRRSTRRPWRRCPPRRSRKAVGAWAASLSSALRLPRRLMTMVVTGPVASTRILGSIFLPSVLSLPRWGGLGEGFRRCGGHRRAPHPASPLAGLPGKRNMKWELLGATTCHRTVARLVLELGGTARSCHFQFDCGVTSSGAVPFAPLL